MWLARWDLLADCCCLKQWCKQLCLRQIASLMMKCCLACHWFRKKRVGSNYWSLQNSGIYIHEFRLLPFYCKDQFLFGRHPFTQAFVFLRFHNDQYYGLKLWEIHYPNPMLYFVEDFIYICMNHYVAVENTPVRFCSKCRSEISPVIDDFELFTFIQNLAHIFCFPYRWSYSSDKWSSIYHC